ncbi:predicted protein [Naegleria gruberi]|uniref:Predicted protein n=1 Tax=Naegleria gruberi TaxID=5762 RepID=D2VIZ1_NAEGR|nr:uncharacterized protein NAEGRDRAFT_68848 [Naegleria gruberi]EFC43186.1 predicted protein [Naegleria gruberi]|eukprot:XP_002675930.1 predicted protein [Naegleria gruberi strain NEG-M]
MFLVWVGVGLLCYWVYYKYFICEKVKLYYDSNNSDIEYLVKHTYNLRSEFCPTPYLTNEHLQTIFNVAFRPDINWFSYDSEDFTFSCGGRIILDWVHDNRPIEEQHKENEITDESPIMIVFAGVCGGSKEIEIKHFVSNAVRDACMRAVVVNYRGAQTGLNTPIFGLTTEDMGIVLRHIKSKYPKSKAMIGCGFSLGSNIMTKYLGEVGSDTPIDFAIAVSNPFELGRSSERLRTEFINNLIYDKVFTKKRKELILAHEHLYENTPVKIDQVKRVSSTMEFDDAVSKVLLGGDSLSGFYQQCSCSDDVAHVKVPILFLSSLDDPISCKGVIPYSNFAKNSNTILATTKRGGHVAWLDGMAPYKALPSWMERTCVQFAKACVALKEKKGQ